MSAFGAAYIGNILKQHAAFLSPALHMIPVDPADIKKACPKCEHVNARNPNEQRSKCQSEACGTEMSAERVATFNLAKRFFTADVSAR